MLHLQMLVCGAAGGAMVTLVTLYRYVQIKNEWPWKAKNGPTATMYIVVEVIRIILGAGVAWGLAANGQLGTLGAVVVGAGAPAIIDKWQREAPGLAASQQSSELSPQANRAAEDSALSEVAPNRPAVSEGGA